MRVRICARCQVENETKKEKISMCMLFFSPVFVGCNASRRARLRLNHTNSNLLMEFLFLFPSCFEIIIGGARRRLIVPVLPAHHSHRRIFCVFLKFTAVTNAHCIFMQEKLAIIHKLTSPCELRTRENPSEISRGLSSLQNESFRLFNVLSSKHAENGIYCCWPHGWCAPIISFVRILRVNCRHEYNNNKIVLCFHPTEKIRRILMLSFTQWTRSSLHECDGETLYSFSFLFFAFLHSVGRVFLKIHIS